MTRIIDDNLHQWKWSNVLVDPADFRQVLEEALLGYDHGYRFTDLKFVVDKIKSFIENLMEKVYWFIKNKGVKSLWYFTWDKGAYSMMWPTWYKKGQT